jgi:hypothetical protein
MPPRRLASGRGPNGSQLPRCGSICARMSPVDSPQCLSLGFTVCLPDRVS